MLINYFYHIFDDITYNFKFFNCIIIVITKNIVKILNLKL